MRKQVDKTTDKQYRERLGNEIRKLRLKHKFKQQELGEKTGLCYGEKSCRAAISNIERGNRMVSLAELKKISDILEIPCSSIIAETFNETIQYEETVPICYLHKKCHNEKKIKLVDLLMQLDEDDQATIDKVITGMLESKKYQKKKRKRVSLK